MSSTLTPRSVAMQRRRGRRWKLWAGSTEGGGRPERSQEVGNPTARSGEQSLEFLSPARLGTQSSSRPKLYHPPDPPPPTPGLHSVSLHLPLIGFNERFNNTALPVQIKLLLSAALNPGSLLLNASTSRDSPFCRTPPLLPHTSSLSPTPPAHPSVCPA